MYVPKYPGTNNCAWPRGPLLVSEHHTFMLVALKLICSDWTDHVIQYLYHTADLEVAPELSAWPEWPRTRGEFSGEGIYSYFQCYHTLYGGTFNITPLF